MPAVFRTRPHEMEAVETQDIHCCITSTARGRTGKVFEVAFRAPCLKKHL